MAERIDVETLKEKMEWLASENSKHKVLLKRMYESRFPRKEVGFLKEHIGPELKPVVGNFRASRI